MSVSSRKEFSTSPSGVLKLPLSVILPLIMYFKSFDPPFTPTLVVVP